jgi:hypothetical protein
MAVRTDITLEGQNGAGPIQVRVGDESISFKIIDSSKIDAVNNSVHAVGQLADILKKDYTIGRSPESDISIKIVTPNGPDIALAAMAAKLFEVNGAIGKDQLSKFEGQLKSLTERTAEPFVANAQEQPKAGIASQLSSIRAAMSSMIGGMHDPGTVIASSKDISTPPRHIEPDQANLRTT